VFESIAFNSTDAIIPIQAGSWTERCAFVRSRDKKESVDISGNTLLVYFYLLRSGQTCGVREIQRALGFSSSSSAHYHLEKLVHRGILNKDSYGNYRINGEARVRLVDRFFVFRGFVFPKQLFYAAATTIMCLFFTLLFWDSLTLTIVLALLPGVVASGILWYDAAKLWSSLPSFKKSVR
jgi:hypothetical protein